MSIKRTVASTICALVVVTNVASAKATKTVLPVDPATGRIVYSGAVKIEGSGGPSLYSRASAWTADAKNSQVSAMTVGDPSVGRVVFTGALELDHGRAYGSILFYKLTIDVADGRYRFEVANLIFRGDGYFFKDKDRELESMRSQSVITSVDEAVRSMLTSLEHTMRADATTPTTKGEVAK